jgi:hypothetical protein
MTSPQFLLRLTCGRRPDGRNRQENCRIRTMAQHSFEGGAAALDRLTQLNDKLAKLENMSVRTFPAQARAARDVIGAGA